MEDNQPDEKSEEDKQDNASETTDDQSTETTPDKEDQDNKDNKDNKEDKEDKEDKGEPKEEPAKDSEQKEEEGKPPELIKDDIIKILKTFSGVGQVIAERIYDSGFDNRERLKAVTVEDLKKIDGVGQVMAEDIATNMEAAIKRFDEPEKKEEPKKEGKGITGKAIGFVKGTISKITGFFKGKSPKPKPKAEESKVTEPGKVKPEIEPKSESTTDTGEQKSTKDGAGDETYFPEVGSPKEELEEKPKHEPVSVESSDTEPASKILEIEKESKETVLVEESKPEPKPETEPEPQPVLESKKEPTINMKNSSGLLVWFEASPNLRPEAGRLLFKAGYNNLEELMEAVVEDLVLVNGINEVEAKTIYSELKKLH